MTGCPHPRSETVGGRWRMHWDVCIGIYQRHCPQECGLVRLCFQVQEPQCGGDEGKVLDRVNMAELRTLRPSFS